MPWINPERKETRERLTLKIDVRVLRQLEDYAVFVDSTQSYVVAEILRAVFGRDKDFQTWLQTRTSSYDRSYDPQGVNTEAAAGAATDARVRRRRRTSSTVSATAPVASTQIDE